MQYTQLAKLTKEQRDWFAEKEIALERDSAHFNDDWPLGRGVFLDEERTSAVLVNFEDHIRVVALSDKGDLLSCAQNLH